MKKKIILAITLIAALATLVGCGNNENVANETSADGTTTEVVEEINPEDYVTPGDYSALTIEIAPKTEVLEADIEAKYQEVINANVSFEMITEDRAAKDGDFVEIDYIGTVDGEEFDSGTIGAEGTEFFLGSGAMIPGFEEALIGMTIEEQKIADITFPDGYSEELGGKDAQFDLTLNAIKMEVYPEVLTAEMITMANPTCKTEEELRAAFKEELAQAIDAAYIDEQKMAAFNLILADSTFAEELPESMVTDYQTQLIQETQQYADQYQVDLETFVSTYAGQTLDEFYVEVDKQAVVYVKRDLLMQVLILKEEVEVTSKEVSAFGEENFALYGYASSEEFITAYGEENFYPALKVDKVFDLILANTTTDDLVAE